MNEKELLRRLRSGETEALERVMDLYSAYVYAIVKNIIDPPLQPEDCEEVVSDVFLQLWHSAGDVQAGKLKAGPLAVPAYNKLWIFGKRQDTVSFLDKAGSKLRQSRIKDAVNQDQRAHRALFCV